MGNIKTPQKGKVILRLNGGLGNQMFQWALARMIEETTDMDVLLDMSYFNKRYARPYQLNIFRLEPKFVRGFWLALKLDIIWMFRAISNWEKNFGITLYSEKQFNFDTDINKIGPETYINGFFQSELYFKCVEDKIREDFRFEKSPSDENLKLINRIYTENSVSVHIRRGDYVEKKRYQDQYAECSLDYYQNAVAYIAKEHPEPTLFVFSDDIKWVRHNLKFPYKTVYVSHNTGKNSCEDLRLMSVCKHNIIANSSFSWWGAWLNANPNKIVIAPNKWFNDDEIIQTDVIPKTWVQLDN